jgi:outer membrane protein, heavy metal efflux system
MKVWVRCLRPLVLLVLASPFLLHSGEFPLPAEVNASDGLSAGEAAILAVQRNPQLLALRKGHSVAEGRVSEAKALPNPELRTGRIDFGDDSAGIRSRNYNLGLRWSPPRPGEMGLKGSGALRAVSEADGEIAAAEQKLATEIRLLHTKIVFLDEQIKLAEASTRVRQQIVDFIGAQVEAGTKTLLDQSVAELALADSRSVTGAYQLERRLAATRLAGELDLPRSTDLRIQVEGEPLLFQARAFDEAGLIESALTLRPELEAISARCSQADTALQLRKRDRYPWFSFIQLDREFDVGQASDSWGFRLGVDLPIFKWKASLLRAPTAEAERCALEMTAAKRGIAQDVEELVEYLRTRASELEYYRQTIEPLVNRDVQLSQQARDAGNGDEFLCLTAEARRLRGRQDYLTKLLDYRRLEVQLDGALGKTARP